MCLQTVRCANAGDHGPTQFQIEASRYFGFACWRSSALALRCCTPLVFCSDSGASRVTCSVAHPFPIHHILLGDPGRTKESIRTNLLSLQKSFPNQTTHSPSCWPTFCLLPLPAMRGPRMAASKTLAIATLWQKIRVRSFISNFLLGANTLVLQTALPIPLLRERNRLVLRAQVTTRTLRSSGS